LNQKNWTEIEINSVFNDKRDRTFEDLFPSHLYIEAFNQYCHSLSNLEIFESKYQDLPKDKKTVTPIIDEVTNHFESFLPEGKKGTITKQDVIRILLDNIDMLSEPEQIDALEKIFELMEKIVDDYRRIK
jgi:hypothetical protein